MGSSATSTEITDPEKQCDLNHLIIVCCHAIYLAPPSANIMDSSTTIASSRPDELPSSSEANWLIEPFQRGEIATYVGHIEAGIRALAADKHAILVFSGGATKPEKTERTEADSYLSVALEHGLFGNSDPTILRRILVDRFATDSYQNILLSLIQFPLFVQKLLGSTDSAMAPMLFPKKITIVSHDFKRARFLDLHLPALQWQGETIFIGINPPFEPVKMAEIEQGDRLRGYGAWEKDIYGVGAALAKKRTARGWNEEEFRRQVLARLPTGTLRTQTEDLVGLRDEGQDLTKAYEGGLPWK